MGLGSVTVQAAGQRASSARGLRTKTDDCYQGQFSFPFMDGWMVTFKTAAFEDTDDLYPDMGCHHLRLRI